MLGGLIGSHWFLFTALILPDGHVQHFEDQYIKKEYCMQKAKAQWVDYYSTGGVDPRYYSTICQNEDNPYDFVKLVCEQNGYCNHLHVK